jgi:hypothetical protein
MSMKLFRCPLDDFDFFRCLDLNRKADHIPDSWHGVEAVSFGSRTDGNERLKGLEAEYVNEQLKGLEAKHSNDLHIVFEKTQPSPPKFGFNFELVDRGEFGTLIGKRVFESSGGTMYLPCLTDPETFCTSIKDREIRKEFLLKTASWS